MWTEIFFKEMEFLRPNYPWASVRRWKAVWMSEGETTDNNSGFLLACSGTLLIASEHYANK